MFRGESAHLGSTLCHGHPESPSVAHALPMAHLGQGFPFGLGARPQSLQAVTQTSLSTHVDHNSIHKVACRILIASDIF